MRRFESGRRLHYFTHLQIALALEDRRCARDCVRRRLMEFTLKYRGNDLVRAVHDADRWSIISVCAVDRRRRSLNSTATG